MLEKGLDTGMGKERASHFSFVIFRLVNMRFFVLKTEHCPGPRAEVSLSSSESSCESKCDSYYPSSPSSLSFDLESDLKAIQDSKPTQSHADLEKIQNSRIAIQDPYKNTLANALAIIEANSNIPPDNESDSVHEQLVECSKVSL